MDEETGKLKTNDVIGNPMAAPEGLPSPKLDSQRAGGDNQGPHSALQVEEGRPRRRQQNEFPWKGGPMDSVRKWLLSPPFQAAAQLSIGTFVVALFVFIGHISFREACLATVFFVAAMLLVAKDCHLGSRLAGACIVLGALWFGGLTAACAISLGRAPRTSYTTYLIVFMGLGLMVTTTLRVKGNLGVGIISNLGFGIMLIAGQFVWPAQPLWQYIYTSILRIGLVAAGGVFVAGVFVLPSLAGDDLRLKVASIIGDLGHVISEGSSHLLLRKEDEQLLFQDKSKEDIRIRADSSRAVNLRMTEEDPEEKEMERSTHPGLDLRPAWTKEKGVATISELRPRLARCREVFQMSTVEPPFVRLLRAPYNALKWPAVMNALDTLVLRVAAIESIIEGDDPMMLDGEIKNKLGLSLLPAFRLMFAQLAASCASAGLAIKADVTGCKTGHQLVFEPSWAVIEYELAGSLYTGMKQFWNDIKASGAKDFINPTPEMRALFYLGTIGTAMMEAMAAFEKALRAALHTPYMEVDTDKAAQPVLDAIQILRQAAASKDLPSLIGAPPDQLHPVDLMCNREMAHDQTASQREIHGAATHRPEMSASITSFKRSMSIRPIQKSSRLHPKPPPPVAEDPPPVVEDPPPPADGKHAHAHAMAHMPHKAVAAAESVAKERLVRYFVWAIPLLKAMFAWDVVVIFKSLVMTDIPKAFGSPKKAWHTIRRDRWFQFALKYYAASLIALSLILALQSHYPKVRAWNGLYVDITVVVVLSEKVDTTFTKGMLRIVTTIVGAVLGFLVMLDTDVATNPYGLMAILCAFGFLCGLLSLGPLKYALFLTLITFYGVILCQYNGHNHGSTHNFYTRVVVTVWGVLLCLAFDLFFPWYAAASAMDTMGRGFEAAGEVMQHFMDVLSEELELGYLRGRSHEQATLEQQQGLLRLEKGILVKRIAGPLGGVQISLEREGVLWRRGILAMPLIVRQSVALLRSVLDRLAAVELMLLQKPIVSGRYSGAPWRFLHEPLTPIKDELAAALLRLCKATCQVMGEFATPEDLTILDTAIQEVHQARLKWRANFKQRLNAYLHMITTTGPVDPLIAERSVDDGIRYQSTMFALSKAVDKMMLLARTVAADPWMQQRAMHPHTWSTWHSWTGNYGY